MSKITLNNVASFQNDSTAVASYAANNATLTTAFDNTLSRDGTTPNQMGASFDMNGNRILNLPAPASSTDPLRVQDLSSYVVSTGNAIIVPGTTVTNNLVTWNSNTGAALSDSGIGASSAATLFNNIKQTATTAASGVVQLGSTVRELLTATRTYFVNASTGSDSNNGLTSGTAFLTIQKALNVAVGTLDFGGQAVIISVANGTYTQSLSVTPWTGGGTLTLTGNTGTPSNCLINPVGVAAVLISGSLPGVFTIQGFKMTGQQAINHTGIGVVNIGSNEFGTTGGSQIVAAQPGAFLNITAAYTISGGGVAHYNINSGAVLQAFISATITVTGTPAFTTFASCTSGQINTNPPGSFNYSGSATGSRYAVSAGGIINTLGGGANFFPGNSAGSGGTTAGGGYYL